MLKNLIVFVKNPILGTVKTRLAKNVGAEVALEVYVNLVEQTRKQVLSVDATRHLFYSKAIKQDNWSSLHFKKHLQIGDDLGQKLKAAFAELNRVESKTIVIGSDCYDLTAEIIEEAYNKLDGCDVVIGPANDGGYYLLGTKRFIPRLFEGISWSTEKVLEETKKIANDLGLKVCLLQELIDVDNIEDLNMSGYPHQVKREI